jgi:electron transport complex protein RnfG
MMRKVLQLGVTLAICCAIAAFGLSYTYGKTWGLIEKQIQENRLKAARKVLPAVEGNEGLRELSDVVPQIKGKVEMIDRIFEGRDPQGNVAGFAMQVLPRGYGGPIVLMVGIGPDGTVIDTAVVEHKETPGLGTEIENPVWKKQFAGKSKDSVLAINKDIDAISGATISSKAMLRGVKGALAAHSELGGGGE